MAKAQAILFECEPSRYRLTERNHLTVRAQQIKGPTDFNFHRTIVRHLCPFKSMIFGPRR